MRTKRILILVFAVMLLLAPAMRAQEINIKNYLKGKDATLAVYEALKDFKKLKAKKIIFPKGTYEFWPDFAGEKYVFASNNDEGLKRIVFDLSGMKNMEIDGQGSSFIFHGFVCPFLLDKSENIVFKNFTIDYSRTFHSEGKITAVYKDSMDVWFSPSYPYRVNNYRLEFLDEKGTLYPFEHLLEFDVNKKETAFRARDFYYSNNVVTKDLGQGNVRLFLKDSRGTVGNILTFNALQRLIPAFTVKNSSNIHFSDLSIYHAGGMGILGQQSRDIFLERIKVTPAPGSGRVISLTADATHFVNCSGKVSMIDCLFENQLDDATNVHGIYVRIEEIISPTEVMVKLVHPQQAGFDFLFPNVKVEVADKQTLMATGENVIQSSERINKEYTRVKLVKPLPAKTKAGDLLSALDENSETIIKGCTIRNNRARGILLGSRGKMLIEGNYFHSQGAAILLEGDGSKWFEQAGVRNLRILNNTFDNCNYNLWGSGVITVMAGIAGSKRPESKYNQNILIENNLFKLCAPNILSMYCIDGLTFHNNKVENDTTYKVVPKVTEPFIMEHSTNINIEY